MPTSLPHSQNKHRPEAWRGSYCSKIYTRNQTRWSPRRGIRYLFQLTWRKALDASRAKKGADVETLAMFADGRPGSEFSSEIRMNMFLRKP